MIQFPKIKNRYVYTCVVLMITGACAIAYWLFALLAHVYVHLHWIDK